MNNDILLNRKILSWGWWNDPNTAHLFVHLILSANYHDGKYRDIVVKRGQLVTGRHQLSEQTGLSERSVRTALNHLKSTNEVTIKSTKQYSLITIVKYSDYQLSSIPSDQQADQQLDQQPTNNRPTTDHIQLSKVNKSISNITPIAPTGGEKKSDVMQRFESFWKAYPRKVGKVAAAKVFEKLKPSEDQLAEMLKAIEAQKKTRQWQEDERYIPHPTTWLNQGRWTDEVSQSEGIDKGNPSFDIDEFVNLSMEQIHKE